MPSEKDGVMIILSSPSGAGKTTLVKKLSEKDNFEISISHTTRQPRPNENRNEDYFFGSAHSADPTIAIHFCENSIFAQFYRYNVVIKRNFIQFS